MSCHQQCREFVGELARPTMREGMDGLLSWQAVGRTGGIADSGNDQVALFFSLRTHTCWSLHLGSSLGFMYGEQGPSSAELTDLAAAHGA